MNSLNYSIVFFFMILLNSYAQEPTFNQDVLTYLDSNGSMKQYDYAYGQLLQMLEKQYPKSEKNKDGWQYLENNKENALTEMKQMLVSIYTTNFEPNDIQQMIVFYQSGAGKQLTNDRSKMTDSQKQQLNTFYNSEVGSKIIDKQTILTEGISKISESWSRDLYETALSLLKE